MSPQELSKIKSEPKALEQRNKLFVEGISMTQDIMAKALSKYGIAEYNPLGDKFNPNLHEASFEFEDGKKAPGTIAAIIQSGYKIGKRILRAPKVGVIKKKPATAPAPATAST